MNTRNGAPSGVAERLADMKYGVVGAAKGVKEHDMPILAAGVAFRIFLSLFPALAAVIAVWSLIADVSAMVRMVDDLLLAFPQQVQNLVGQEIENLASGERAGIALIIGIVAGLWAATSAASMLMKALTRINGSVESRNFALQRLIALGLVMVLFVGMAALIGLIVFGPQLREFLLPEGLFGGLARPLFGVLQFAGAIAVLVVVIGVVYWIGPDRDNNRRVRRLTSGSVFAVLGWLGLSVLFSMFTQVAGEFGLAYSGLASVVVTLLWLQLSMIALMLGAALDAALDERARQRQEPRVA